MSDRPTPETDAYYWCLRKQRESLAFARDLERQRDDAREILAATLKALPVGYLPAHTPESIPERVADLVARYAETESQRDGLAAWKRAQLSVDDAWDAQSVAKLLNVPLGHSIRPAIEPGIRRLISQRDAYAETLRHLCAVCHEKVAMVITDLHPEIAGNAKPHATSPAGEMP